MAIDLGYKSLRAIFVIGDQNIIDDLQREEREEINEKKRNQKMIYRKWSLLTGPPAILGGIVVSLAVANFIFVKEDPFLKPKERKAEPASK